MARIKRQRRFALKYGILVDCKNFDNEIVQQRVDDRFDFLERADGIGWVAIRFCLLDKDVNEGSAYISLLSSSEMIAGSLSGFQIFYQKKPEGFDKVGFYMYNGGLIGWESASLGFQIKEGVSHQLIIVKVGLTVRMYLDAVAASDVVQSYNSGTNPNTGLGLPIQIGRSKYYSDGGGVVQKHASVVYELAVGHGETLDRKNGQLFSGFIDSMYALGNYIPGGPDEPDNLHEYVVEHLVCQEKSGNKLYSMVGRYNYAKETAGNWIKEPNPTNSAAWTLGTSANSAWSIDDNGLQYMGRDASISAIHALTGYNLVPGRKYRIKFTVSNYNQGSFLFFVGQNLGYNWQRPDLTYATCYAIIAANGAFEFEVEANAGNSIAIMSNSGFAPENPAQTVTLTNIRLESLNPALTPVHADLIGYAPLAEMVVNGDFANGHDNWIVDDESAWVIDDSGALHKNNDGVNSPASVHFIYQNINFRRFGLYEVEVHVTGTGVSGARIWLNGFGGQTVQYQENGTVTHLLTAATLADSVNGVFKKVMWASDYGQLNIGSQAAPVEFKVTKVSVKPYEALERLTFVDKQPYKLYDKANFESLYPLEYKTGLPAIVGAWRVRPESYVHNYWLGNYVPSTATTIDLTKGWTISVTMKGLNNAGDSGVSLYFIGLVVGATGVSWKQANANQGQFFNQEQLISPDDLNTYSISVSPGGQVFTGINGVWKQHANGFIDNGNRGWIILGNENYVMTNGGYFARVAIWERDLSNRDLLDLHSNGQLNNPNLGQQAGLWAYFLFNQFLNNKIASVAGRSALELTPLDGAANANELNSIHPDYAITTINSLR